MTIRICYSQNQAFELIVCKTPIEGKEAFFISLSTVTPKTRRLFLQTCPERICAMTFPFRITIAGYGLAVNHRCEMRRPHIVFPLRCEA